eukprot:scaffold9953_cov32-Tisochrysis_lutea.AAC.4
MASAPSTTEYCTRTSSRSTSMTRHQTSNLLLFVVCPCTRARTGGGAPRGPWRQPQVAFPLSARSPECLTITRHVSSDELLSKCQARTGGRPRYSRLHVGIGHSKGRGECVKGKSASNCEWSAESESVPEVPLFVGVSASGPAAAAAAGACP